MSALLRGLASGRVQMVSARFLSRSVNPICSGKIPKMSQVEVDEEHVKQKLGNIQMEFVRMAERQNAERAKRHTKYRKKDWIIAITCFTIAISIYGYTMYAIKQEKFLDDFEMPDPLAEDPRAKKVKVN